MSAQDGGSLELLYGDQGEQQDGGALVLEYTTEVVRRRLVAGLRAPWTEPVPVAREIRAIDLPAAGLDQERRATWVPGRLLQAQDRAVWGVAEAISEETRVLWGKFAARFGQETQAPWVLARPKGHERQAPWGKFAARPMVEVQAPWALSVKHEREVQAPWGKFAARFGQERRIVWGLARRTNREYWLPWTKFSRQLGPGWGIPQPGGEPPVDENGTIIVPSQEVYIVINEVSLVRVVDSVQIPATGASLSLDRASWSWSFSASVPRDQLPLVQRDVDGIPVEVELSVNGEPFRFVIEDLQGDREFAKGDLRITGRSKSAGLSEPNAPTMNFFNDADRTVEQLANDVLTDNGVPLGWSVVFDPVDWLVPEGAWSHRGTYISALTTIAAAAGAYLQPHDFLDEMRFRLQYPAAPWDWGDVVPYIELPAAVVVREGIQWLTKPIYDRVFVQGEAPGGVQGDVVRIGTAGTREAPQVIDPLITAEAAARQRGIPVLADVGQQAIVDLRLPVLETTGIIRPGTFVRYVDGATTRIGLVRSVAVSVNMPVVSQVISVETHGY